MNRRSPHTTGVDPDYEGRGSFYFFFSSRRRHTRWPRDWSSDVSSSDLRAPAAELDQALRRAVLGGEVALLVVAGPVTPLVHGGPEQPGRPERLVQWDHRRLPGDLVEQVEDGLRQVVRVDGTAGDADDGQARLGPPLPAEVV